MIIDRLGEAEAAAQLRVCCGAHRWIEGMLAARPFGSADRARQQADRVWQSLGPTDWLEAFDHHPRIGERKTVAGQDTTAAARSSNEQAQVTKASAELKKQLAQVNADYEQRFGFIYIVSAAGRSAEDLLSIARDRLENDRDTELRVAADEQRKIMQLRLAKLLETT
jgi:2-oxo-4-hydroxy-4-carboxy-5-ureidoimidazoline decarboxylase